MMGICCHRRPHATRWITPPVWTMAGRGDRWAVADDPAGHSRPRDPRRAGQRQGWSPCETPARSQRRKVTQVVAVCRQSIDRLYYAVNIFLYIITHLTPQVSRA